MNMLIHMVGMSWFHFSSVQFSRDPMDCSLPGSSIHAIFQVRVLEWGTIAFSNFMANQFSSVQLLSCVRLFVTPWTATRQTSLSITSSRSLLVLMSIESVMPSN